MQTEFMLLSIYNKPRLDLNEVCGILGMAKTTAYTQRSLGRFPIQMSGVPLMADIRDVAEHLDELRRNATEKSQSIDFLIERKHSVT